MREAILIKTGEIALKGLNRHTFEQILVKNIRFRLKKFGKVNITKSQSTIRVEPKEENMDFDAMAEAISKIFGISAFSRTLVTKKNLDVIKQEAVEYLKDQLPYVETFKVEAKRSDKQFPYTSPQLQQELGGALLEAYPHLKVDVHHPQLTVTVEIRDEHAYVHGAQTPGAGGMPVSSSGKARVYDRKTRFAGDGGPFCQPALYQRPGAGEGGNPL